MADQKKKQSLEKRQEQPGKRSKMQVLPETENETYRGQEKLKGKVALVTGGDSGIGRAVSIMFAQEGADVVIVYLNEHEDAAETRKRVESYGGRCLAIAGDVGNPVFCGKAVSETVEGFGKLDILVNNAAEQHAYDSILDVSPSELEKTFATNIFSMFYFVQAALPYLQNGGVIINSTSVTAYEGHAKLIPYACTKGAITSLTRSLAMSLAEQGIRVNGVAPGPVWTPLIPASFSEEKMEKFGSSTLLGRAGQPVDIAPSYLFLACRDSSFMTGQVLHPNGGRIVNG
ncbi:MAG: SDR family oxidoreductase [Desulfobulbaceae bacterium]|nr:SDR family oxidoreductase [Desulfobulbaceae bacterium]